MIKALWYAFFRSIHMKSFYFPTCPKIGANYKQNPKKRVVPTALLKLRRPAYCVQLKVYLYALTKSINIFISYAKKGRFHHYKFCYFSCQERGEHISLLKGIVQ
jgi:hypothetical protein